MRQGKYIEIDLAETDSDAAQAAVEQMCGSLLANPLIENYKIDLEA